MKSKVIIISIAFTLLIGLNPLTGTEKIDRISSDLIKKYTTKPEFLSPLVDHIPESNTIPSPRDFLGYVVGTPKKLTYAKDIHRYFLELARQSKRISVYEIGKSNEGRTRILAVIADESTLSEMETYKSYMKKLADPRSIEEEEAQTLMDVGKPFYLISGGLHANETGSPDMLMELAYRLVASNSLKMKAIRENVITLIIPVLEVDGRERQVDWYYQQTINRKEWDTSFPMSPPYRGKYAYHDVTREGIEISQPIYKQIYDVFYEYFPVTTLDLHEPFPLLFIFSGTGPYNLNFDPIIITEIQLYAHYEVSELTKFGMPGVWTWGVPVGWHPGYLLWISSNHNAIGRFYETLGNQGANTFERKIQGEFANIEVTKRTWFRVKPPPKKVTWSYRNSINYMQTGVITSLYFTSLQKRMLLENFWKKGKNALEKGRNEPPFAWIIQPDQKNAFMVEHLVNQLHRHGIEVHSLSKKYTYNDHEYPVGTLAVRLDQPYGPFAKNLLEKQEFPGDITTVPLNNDVTWTIGLQYGVKTIRIDSKDIFDVPLTTIHFPYSANRHFPKSSSPSYYLIPHNGSPSMTSLRYTLKDVEVFSAENDFVFNEESFPAGTWVIRGDQQREVLGKRLKEAANRFALDVVATDTKPPVPLNRMDIPKIGVYHSWVYRNDSGWLRYTLDAFGVEYRLINDDVLRNQTLLQAFDIIIIPECGNDVNLKYLIQGINDKWKPLPYIRTEKFPNIGVIDQTDDMTRGMGFKGLKNLDEFVDQGKLLITLGGGSVLPVEVGIAPRVERIHPARVTLINPGSFVKTRILQKDSPITYGYPEETYIFADNDPLLEVAFDDRKYIVMQYGLTTAKDYPEESERESRICLSGYVKNQEQLIHKPAILCIPRGSGRVVLFSFNPAHRYLNHHDFGFLFNTIMHWNDL